MGAAILEEEVWECGCVEIKQRLGKFRIPLSWENNLAVKDDGDWDVCCKKHDQKVE